MYFEQSWTNSNVHLATIILPCTLYTPVNLGRPNLLLPNVYFQLNGAEDKWTYRDPFDPIHLRGLSGTFRDWSAIYQQAFQHLKPGGDIKIAGADLAADAIYVPNVPKDSYGHRHAVCRRRCRIPTPIKNFVPNCPIPS